MQASIRLLVRYKSDDAKGIANSGDPDQTAPLELSDKALHCLPKHGKKIGINTVLSLIYLLFSFNKNLCGVSCI